MKQPHTFRRLPQGRTLDAVVAELRAALAGGHLNVGEKLPAESALAAQFGVSRSVLREALKALELSGYLTVRRGYGGGTFVAAEIADEFAPVSAPTVPTSAVSSGHLRDARLAMEPVAARLAAERLGLPERLSYRDLKNVSLDDERPYYVLSSIAVFHAAVARASGNPVFAAVIDGLRPALHQALKDVVLDEAWRHRCESEHRRIAQHIEAGEGKAAAQAMHRHLLWEIEAS